MHQQKVWRQRRRLKSDAKAQATESERKAEPVPIHTPARGHGKDAVHCGNAYRRGRAKSGAKLLLSMHAAGSAIGHMARVSSGDNGRPVQSDAYRRGRVKSGAKLLLSMQYSCMLTEGDG
jgi:hypothetical protein